MEKDVTLQKGISVVTDSDEESVVVPVDTFQISMASRQYGYEMAQKEFQKDAVLRNAIRQYANDNPHVVEAIVENLFREAMQDPEVAFKLTTHESGRPPEFIQHSGLGSTQYVGEINKNLILIAAEELQRIGQRDQSQDDSSEAEPA